MDDNVERGHWAKAANSHTWSKTCAIQTIVGEYLRESVEKKNAGKKVVKENESIEKQSFIKNRIAKFVEFWRPNMARNRRYLEDMSLYISYMGHIHQEICNSLPTSPENLQEIFWPSMNWKGDNIANFALEEEVNMPNITLEDDPEQYQSCSLAQVRPMANFNPYMDVLYGDFVVCYKESLSCLARPSLEMCWPSTWAELREIYGRMVDSNEKKKRSKKLVTRECWTKQWTKDLILYEMETFENIFFSYKTPSLTIKDLPATHLILESAITTTLATL